MILYNLRYRGPYEYDKFILNTFQLVNEIRRMEKKLDGSELTKLREYRKEIDEIYERLTGSTSSLQKLHDIKEGAEID